MSHIRMRLSSLSTDRHTHTHTEREREREREKERERGKEREVGLLHLLLGNDPEIQWKLSIVDTIGNQLAVLYTEVFLI